MQLIIDRGIFVSSGGALVAIKERVSWPATPDDLVDTGGPMATLISKQRREWRVKVNLLAFRDGKKQRCSFVTD